MQQSIDPLFSVEEAELAERFHTLAQLLAAGYSDDEIAVAMAIKKQTVWNYIKQMQAATESRNRPHLIAKYTIYALRNHEELLTIDEVVYRRGLCRLCGAARST